MRKLCSFFGFSLFDDDIYPLEHKILYGTQTFHYLANTTLSLLQTKLSEFFFFKSTFYFRLWQCNNIYLFCGVGGGLGGGTAPLASPRIRHRTLHWHSDMSDSRQYPLKLCLIKHELDIIVFVFETDNFLIWIYTGFITFQARNPTQIIVLRVPLRIGRQAFPSESREQSL